MTRIFFTFAIAVALTSPVSKARDISFTQDVRPLLAANCLACHGQDENKRKGDLRLDQRDAATSAAKGGLIAIVPKEPDKSELLKRISSTDPEVRMPPAKSKKEPLSAEQIALLTQWIAQGAPYDNHWGFTARCVHRSHR